MAPPSVPPHRLSRRALRRQAARRRAWVIAASILVVWACGAGYAWRHWRTAKVADGPPVPQVTAEQRAEARALLDRAIAARFDELDNEAARLVSDARRLDPDVPGAAIFTSLLAFDRGDAEAVAAAAKEALDDPRYAGDARVVLALNTWLQRGQDGADSAGGRSALLFAEAAESALANHQVRFFAGDLLRATGRPAEAHANLLGSLFRQAPWDSSALLVAKMWLALEEAGSAARSGAVLAIGPEGEIYGGAALRLKRLLDSGTGTAAGLDEVRTVLTAKQASLLLGDPAMGAAGTAANEGDRGLLPPFAEAVSAVEVEEEEIPPEAPRENLGKPRLFQLPENVPLGQ